MKKLLLIFAVCSGLVFSISHSASAYVGDVGRCLDFYLHYARGSGAPHLGSDEFMDVVRGANNIISTHDLSVSVADLFYPAVDVSTPARIIGAYISAGLAYSFGDSVRIGVSNLKADYEVTHRECPLAHFGFVGYSQGAMVVSQAVKDFDAKFVDFVLLYGDPNTYLPEGEGLFPDACSGKNLSPWRTYAPNCHTYEGIFGGRKPYEAAGLEGKYMMWCNADDYICGSSRNVFINSGHTQYSSSGEIVYGIDMAARKYVEPRKADDAPPEFAPMRMRLYSEKAAAASGADFDAPVVELTRDGDSASMAWGDAPSGAKYLLVKLNGVDLGYIDASERHLTVGDIVDDERSEFSFVWLREDGELGEVSDAMVLADADSDSGASVDAEPEAVQMSTGSLDDEPDGELVWNYRANTIPESPSPASLPDGGAVQAFAQQPLIRGKNSAELYGNGGAIAAICGILGASGLLLFLVVRRRGVA